MSKITNDGLTRSDNSGCQKADGERVFGSYEAHVSDSTEQHDSIHEAKSSIQQPSYCTLEDCFQLYTRDERVNTLCFDIYWSLPRLL